MTRSAKAATPARSTVDRRRHLHALFFHSRDDACDFCDYESATNHIFSNRDMAASCNYDHSTLSALIVIISAKPHPKAIVGGLRRDSSLLSPSHEFPRVSRESENLVH
jgi:hypothetical protein